VDREANKGETVAARALSMIDITSARVLDVFAGSLKTCRRLDFRNRRKRIHAAANLREA
jgi:hypothetical protein